MAIKQTALHLAFGVFAAVALGSTGATAAESNHAAGQGQTASMQGPSGNLLWLKPSAGQMTCPAGTALAVATNAAGEKVGKPKCVATNQQSSGGDHPR